MQGKSVTEAASTVDERFLGRGFEDIAFGDRLAQLAY